MKSHQFSRPDRIIHGIFYSTFALKQTFRIESMANYFTANVKVIKTLHFANNIMHTHRGFAAYHRHDIQASAHLHEVITVVAVAVAAACHTEYLQREIFLSKMLDQC